MPECSKEGEDGSCGAGRNPQLVAWIEIAPAVRSQTAVRRRNAAMPVAALLRRLRSPFFLGHAGRMLTGVMVALGLAPPIEHDHVLSSAQVP